MKQYKISEQNRDALIQYLDNSGLPHNDVKNMLILLSKLEEIKEELKEKE